LSDGSIIATTRIVHDRTDRKNEHATVWTNMTDFKKDCFFSVEYDWADHVQKIAVFLLLIYIFTFLSVLVISSAYQYITKDFLDTRILLGIFSIEGSNSLEPAKSVIAAPICIPLITTLILTLFRNLLLIGDIYFCNDGVYIRRVLFFYRVKKFDYKNVQVLHREDIKKLNLVYNYRRKNTLLYIIYKYFTSTFYFEILKEENFCENYAYRIEPLCSIDDIVSLLKSHGVVVVHRKFNRKTWKLE